MGTTDNYIGNVKGICSGAHAFRFWLNVQQISDLGEVDIQIIIDVDLDNGIKRILNAYDIALKVVHSNGLSPWIYNPIFTHSIILVIIKLADIVI